MDSDPKCLDCHQDTFTIGEFYMVHHGVWAAAGVEPYGGMLCVGCIERRLGRQLTANDFPDTPINREFPVSPRLLGRREALWVVGD